jgi:hypothetical protein
VLGLAIVIVIVLDTGSNSANNAADMTHGLRSRKARRVPPGGPIQQLGGRKPAIASGPKHENEYEHDDDCEHEHEHEHESCVAEASCTSGEVAQPLGGVALRTISRAMRIPSTAALTMPPA